MGVRDEGAMSVNDGAAAPVPADPGGRNFATARVVTNTANGRHHPNRQATTRTARRTA